MDYSLPAWLGGLAGTIVAVALYVPAIRHIERAWRARGRPATPAERVARDARLSVLRRAILAADIGVLATAGYWIGKSIGGK